MRGVPAARRRRIIIIGLLRASAATAVLVAAYYLLPLGRLAGVPLGFSFVVGLVVLTTMSVYQVRAIINARYPAIRAIEALAATAPLFLLLFAAIYFLMAHADLNNFNVHSLTRTDAPYFTVTVFATVGFGDIVATTQLARLVVGEQASWARSGRVAPAVGGDGLRAARPSPARRCDVGSRTSPRWARPGSGRVCRARGPLVRILPSRIATSDGVGVRGARRPA